MQISEFGILPEKQIFWISDEFKVQTLGEFIDDWFKKFESQWDFN